MSRSLLAGAIAALALVAPGTATAQVQPPLGAFPCPEGATPRGAVCHSLQVPLDHSGRTPGTVDVRLARVPATGTKAGTIAIVTGGPGEAAIALSRSVSRLLAPVRQTHDLLFIDQRGTGRSDAVECPVLEVAEDVLRCAEALGARRPFWTSRETAMDIEDVRRALGEPKLTLLGISYGATVAGQYARLFPGSTAGLILDSPAPVDGQDVVEQLRQLALPRVMREICWPPSCRDFLNDPTAALARLVRRLQGRGMQGTVVQFDGRKSKALLTLDHLYKLVVLSDRDPILRAELPAAVASGVAGDAAPLLRLAAAARVDASESAGVSESRALATNCVEGRLPWAPDSPLRGREEALAAYLAATRSAYAPFPVATVVRESWARLCTAWPSTPRPEGVPQRGPDVPVLILSGREDLRTPLEDARRTGGQYPNAKVLGVPDVGHSVLANDRSECALSAVNAFLAGQPVGSCPASEREPITRAPFIPATVKGLRPGPGLPKPVGRAATAVLVTLLEIDRAAAIRGRETGGGDTLRVPGLRGGTARLGEGTFTLRAFEIVRGVRLTGTVGRRSGRLAVTAPGGITGVLRNRRGGTFRGTLGGEPVFVRLDD